MTEGPQVVRASEETAAQHPLGGAVGMTRHRTGRQGASPHAQKFRAAIAVLVGIAVGAVVVVIAVLSDTSKAGGPKVAWSQWSPSDGGLIGAREIADYLSPLYRISGTDQLAVITVINLASPTTATSTNGTVSGLQVAVQSNPSSSAVSLLSGNTIAYNLCGLGGSNCAIGVGAASANRLLLLRREALELALYTFKYVGATDNVVVVLPPGHTTNTCTGICAKPPSQGTTSTPIDIAVLLEHRALAPLLSQPLSFTLPEQFPPTVAEMASAPEASLVDQVTARGLFSEQLVQAQDGSNLLVLSPLPAQ